MPDDPLLPVEWLFDSSDTSLRFMEAAALNHCANLLRCIRADLEQLVEESAKAKLARWMIENRAELLNFGSRQAVFTFDGTFGEARSRKSA